MPSADGTGPMGLGSMTGRRAGFCAGFSVPGYANPVCYGFRRGRGFRRMFCATGIPWRGYFGNQNPNIANFQSEADEKEFLKRQSEFFENQLDNIKKRLEELER